MKAPKSRKVPIPDVPKPTHQAANVLETETHAPDERPAPPVSVSMEEKTVGAILGLPDAPTLPGFVMANSPEELEDPGKKPHVPGESEPPEPEPDDDNAGEEYPGDQPEPINPPWTPPPPIDHEPPAAALNDQLEDLNDARRAIYAAQRGLPSDSQRSIPGRPPPLPIVEDRSIAQQVLDGEVMAPGNVRWVSRIEIVDAWKYTGQLTTAPDWVDRNWLGWGDFDNFRNIEPGPCLRVPAHGRPGEVVLCRIGDWVCRQAVTVDERHSPQLRIEVWAGEHFEQMFMARPLDKRDAA